MTINVYSSAITKINMEISRYTNPTDEKKNMVAVVERILNMVEGALSPLGIFPTRIDVTFLDTNRTLIDVDTSYRWTEITINPYVGSLLVQTGIKDSMSLGFGGFGFSSHNLYTYKKKDELSTKWLDDIKDGFTK